MGINYVQAGGILCSIIAVAIIIYSMVDFLAGWHKVSTLSTLLGLALGVVAINLNNQYLMTRKKSKR